MVELLLVEPSHPCQSVSEASRSKTRLYERFATVKSYVALISVSLRESAHFLVAGSEPPSASSCRSVRPLVELRSIDRSIAVAFVRPLYSAVAGVAAVAVGDSVDMSLICYVAFSTCFLRPSARSPSSIAQSGD